MDKFVGEHSTAANRLELGCNVGGVMRGRSAAFGVRHIPIRESHVEATRAKKSGAAEVVCPVEGVRAQVSAQKLIAVFAVYPPVAAFHVDFQTVCFRLRHFREVGPMPNKAVL